MSKTRNDRNLAVTRFCLAMEEHRRTDAGRVRTAKEFVSQFFPHDTEKANDLLFVRLPNEVRGPVLSAWGIRGAKAAIRDDDERVREVVHDALVAGDIDEVAFEDGLTPEVLIDWLKLPDWWTFWRRGKLTGVAIQKALATARELALIDDTWFLNNIQGRGGKLKGTDVVCDTLSKDQIVAWIRKIHESGDGSPAGLIHAVGWETVLTKTAQDALLFALDAFAKKTGLFVEPQATPAATDAKKEPAKEATDATEERKEPLTATRHTIIKEAIAEMARPEPGSKPRPETPTINAPGDISAIAAEEAAAREALRVANAPESGLSISLDETPPLGAPTAALLEATVEGMNAAEARDRTWTSASAGTDESPKLAEARAAMMATLLGGKSEPRQPWDDSEVPAKPSSLEWGDPARASGTPSEAAASAGTDPASAMKEEVDDIPIEEEDIATSNGALVANVGPAAAPIAQPAPAPHPASSSKTAAAKALPNPPPIPRRGATRSR